MAIEWCRVCVFFDGSGGGKKGREENRGFSTNQNRYKVRTIVLVLSIACELVSLQYSTSEALLN